MPLAGTESALGNDLYAAATGASGDPKKAWEEVAKVIISHITTNAVVTGGTPSGGPVTGGKVT